MNESTFATGRCLCGDFEYTLKSAPVRMAQCHCKHCQRASGTGHMSLAFFKDEDVEMNGEAKGFANTADSGNVNTRYFCPNCGSRVYSRNSARPGVVAIAVGSCDDNNWFEPGAVVYAPMRPDWDLTSTEIPNFDAMPPPPK